MECQPRSKIKISQDDTKMHLKLASDRKFALTDENFLFECMGLTKTTKEELSRIFDSRIIDFLNRHELLETLPAQKSPPEPVPEPVVESAQENSTPLPFKPVLEPQSLMALPPGFESAGPTR